MHQWAEVLDIEYGSLVEQPSPPAVGDIVIMTARKVWFHRGTGWDQGNWQASTNLTNLPILKSISRSVVVVVLFKGAQKDAVSSRLALRMSASRNNNASASTGLEATWPGLVVVAGEVGLVASYRMNEAGSRSVGRVGIGDSFTEPTRLLVVKEAVEF